jgi:hypothetical protein
VPMDDDTVFRGLDPGLDNLATVVTLTLLWGEEEDEDAQMTDGSGGGKMPEIGDDREAVVKISAAEWHDKAYHNGAREGRERRLDNAEKRGTDIRGLQASIPSGKTSCAEKFLEHARVAVERFPVLYSHYKKERAARWETYQKEQKAMHELCMRVKGEDARQLPKEKVVVAFGDARFPSTMRGVRAVPVKRFRKQLPRYVTVVPVSEMRTSRVCSKGCGWDDEPTTREEWKKRKKEYDLINMRSERRACGCPGAGVHAIVICPHCNMTWHRDVNAARNIAYMFWWQRTHAGEMPPRFRRSGGDG